MITIVNKRNIVAAIEQAQESDSRVTTLIYCGRGSPLGNPFPMHREYQRDAVCDQYEAYFKDMLLYPSQSRDRMRAQLDKICEAAKVGDVQLECFCAPKRCHCETIKRYVEEEMLCTK